MEFNLSDLKANLTFIFDTSLKANLMLSDVLQG